ncbi:MAG: hypothetical protein UZ21_OP11001000540 [Microgenomates bacterium OLB22]|nr:MAG: hypothetical protein UZ21_OP11001000540 [Microgenomates bacterium OLB22]
MVYLYLDNATIKLLALSKTMLGQYHVSAFTKKHTTQLLVDGYVHNVDILASAIKEAVLSAQPHQVQEKKSYDHTATDFLFIPATGRAAWYI